MDSRIAGDTLTALQLLIHQASGQGANITVDVPEEFEVNPSSTVLLAADEDRVGVYLNNTDSRAVFLAFGGEDAVEGRGISIPPDGVRPLIVTTLSKLEIRAIRGSGPSLTVACQVFRTGPILGNVTQAAKAFWENAVAQFHL
jgi:hypothetical protein